VRKIIVFILSILFGILSCNQILKIEKIGIENIDLQRNYQDSVIDSDSIPDKKIEKIKSLIGEYKQFENTHGNKDYYNYYLARLYSGINYFPFRNFFYDTVTKKMLRSADYINFLDSSYYYSKRALEINPNNIKAMRILAMTLFWDYNRYLVDKKTVPSLINRNRNKFNEIQNIFLNNFIKFKDLDTSEKKVDSRIIYESAASLLLNSSVFFDNTKFKRTDENKTNALYVLGDIYDHLKSFNETTLIGLDFNKYIKNKVLSDIKMARIYISTKQELQKESELKNSYSSILAKKLYSGRANYIKFDDHGNVTATFERYYQGWNNYTISGNYKIISETQIEVNWVGSNTASWFNIVGSSCDRGGMTKLLQSTSFANLFTYDASLGCVKINYTFNQSYSEGTRCGDESKSYNDVYEFCLN